MACNGQIFRLHTHMHVWIDSPHNSTDFSLTENIWSMVEYQLRAPPPWHDLESFKKAIVVAWESVTSEADTRQALFNSMPRRLKECMNTGGELVH